MSCLEAGHILSNSLKITIFVFLRPQCQSNLKYRQEIEFSQFFEDTTCAKHSYLIKILVTGVTGFLYKRLSGPYSEFQPLPICKFALFT